MTASCLNCGAPLSGPYCANCGQKQLSSDLTLREFVRETTAELTQWEGRVPHTLKTLLLQPGRLTQDFLAGRRARWLAPLRIYLICSVAYFLAAAIGERITHRSEAQLAKVTVKGADGRVSLTAEGRSQIAELLPARIFGVERVERAIANNAQFSQTVDSALPKAMFVLVPVFALLTSLAWRRTVPRYPAHLYLALHLHAAWFGAIAIATILTMFATSLTILQVSGVVMLGYILWYSLVALHRVFGESWIKTVAKALAIGALYAAVLNAISVVILSYAILSA